MAREAGLTWGTAKRRLGELYARLGVEGPGEKRVLAIREALARGLVVVEDLDVCRDEVRGPAGWDLDRWAQLQGARWRQCVSSRGQSGLGWRLRWR